MKRIGRKAAALIQALLLIALSFAPVSAANVKTVVPEAGPGVQTGAVGVIHTGAGAGEVQSVGSISPTLDGSGAFSPLSAPKVSVSQPGLQRTGALSLPSSDIAPKTRALGSPARAPVETPAAKTKVRALGAPGKLTIGRERPEQDGQRKASVIQSLRTHAPEAAKISSIEGSGEASRAAESNFMKAAALGTLASVKNAVQAVAPRTGTLFRRLLRPSGAAETDEKAPAAASDEVPAPGTAREETYRSVTLDNGMEVQLVRDPGLFSATIAVGVGVGGRDGAKSGYAHYAEHMRFQGTKRVKNWFRLVGAMGGYTNAWTYPDHTLYVHTFPSELLELGISLEGERMASLEVTPEKIEREKRTILEEKAGQDNTPYEGGWQRLHQIMFSKPANQRTVIGSEEDIKGVTAESLRAFLDDYYVPGKAKVVITGNIDLDQTEEWVRQHLGTVPARKEKPPQPDIEERELPASEPAEVPDAFASHPAVLFGYRAPRYGRPEYYAAGVIVEMLQERLHQRLLLSRKEAVGVALSMPYLDREPASVTGSIVYGDETSREAMLKALDEEIEAVANGEFTDEELQRQVYRQIQTLDNQLGDAYSASLLLAQAAVRGLDARSLQEDIQRWSKVTRSQVQKAAGKFFRPESRRVVTVKPAPDPAKKRRIFEHHHEIHVDETPTPEEVETLKALEKMQWAPVNFVSPEEFTLPNGLKVVVMPDGRRPTVYSKLAFRLGETASNPKARETVPFAANLLRMRTGIRSEVRMEDDLAAMGGTIVSDQRWDHVVFDGNAPSESVLQLLDMMAEMVTYPHDWTDEELSKWKELWKRSLKDMESDPKGASQQVAVRDILGHHPSAHASLTAEAIDRLTAEELKRLIRTHFAPDNAVLVVAGNVNPHWVKAQLEAKFAGWKASGRTAKPGPAAEIKGQEGISLIDRPGSEQVLIRVSGIQPGDSRQSAEDHFPLLVAGEVMGGGWGSRLQQIARQAKGLAYEAFSQIVTDPAVAMWSFGLLTRPQKAAPALQALLEQAESLRKEKPGALELASARNSLIASFLMSLDQIGNIADQLLGLALFDEPLDSVGRYITRISDVTGKEVQRIAGKYLDPGRMAVTVVGDAEDIRSDLESVMPVREAEPPEPLPDDAELVEEEKPPQDEGTGSGFLSWFRRK